MDHVWDSLPQNPNGKIWCGGDVDDASSSGKGGLNKQRVCELAKVEAWLQIGLHDPQVVLCRVLHRRFEHHLSRIVHLYVFIPERFHSPVDTSVICLYVKLYIFPLNLWAYKAKRKSSSVSMYFQNWSSVTTSTPVLLCRCFLKNCIATRYTRDHISDVGQYHIYTYPSMFYS